MSLYLNNLLTQTTTRYNSLRRTLLNNEEDGDTEDDSHISRVLRAYYTEKGRPFPPWLPPDPNDRRAITPQPYNHTAAAGGSYFNSATSSFRSGQSVASGGGSGGAGGGSRSNLSDLWDAPAAASPAQPQSLRAGRRAAGPPAGGLVPPSLQQQQQQEVQARPLPSQRAGSYQSLSSQNASRGSYESLPPPGGSGGTAQDRLKARLWGGNRASSPLNAGGGGGGGGQYEQQAPSNNPYDTGGSGNGRRFGRSG